jgi:hypothetical protein
VTTLLTIERLRALVRTSLSDVDLQEIIDREDAELVRRYGAHYVDAVTPVIEEVIGNTRNIFVQRRVLSVVSVTEAQSLGYAAVTLASTHYHLRGDQGRITRLPDGRAWLGTITVTYVPADDRPLREQVLIDLVRLTLERTAMQSESVAGEYSYTAPDWEKQRRALYRKLEFPSI